MKDSMDEELGNIRSIETLAKKLKEFQLEMSLGGGLKTGGVKSTKLSTVDQIADTEKTPIRVEHDLTDLNMIQPDKIA